MHASLLQIALFTYLCLFPLHLRHVHDHYQLDTYCHYFSQSRRYQDTGVLELIPYQLSADIIDISNKFQRPVIVSEYGADTMPGLHSDPPLVVRINSNTTSN